MAHTLVKRMDSAHMKRMYDKALETSDADFLSPTSDITIDHVRKLNLGSDGKETIPPRPQNRPPQPPKQKTQPTFSLNSFDLLLEDGDAESWLVATPFDEAKRSQLNSAPVFEEKREVVSSPVDSTVSSELSRSKCVSQPAADCSVCCTRSTCVTPASVLDTKSVQKLKGGDCSDGLNVARPKSVEPRLLDSEQKQRDIRNLPRSIGCVNHTPAPPLDQKTRPEESVPSENTKSTASKLNALDAGKQSATKSLGSKLRGRISGMTQKETKRPTSSIPRARPKSVGPARSSRLSMLSPTPRPKSSLGREREDVKADRVSSRSKKPVTSSKCPPRSSAARSSASLGTVKEEESEKKRLLGFRKPAAQTGPATNLKSALVNSRLGNKAKKPPAQGRIAPQIPIPKPSIGGPKSDSKTAIKLTKPSRIASPSPKRFMSTETGKDNKDGKGLMGFKKSSSSLPPPSQSSQSRLRRISQEASKIKQKTAVKKRL